jgi:hypothetical protein
MGWTKTALRHLRAFARINGVEYEIEAELLFHIEMRTLENVEAGMLPEAARQQALKRFGDLEEVRQSCAEARRQSQATRRARAIKLLSWVLALSGLPLALSDQPEAIQHAGEVLVMIAILLRLFFYVRSLNGEKARSFSVAPEKILFDE